MSPALVSPNKLRIFKHIRGKPRWSQVLLLRRMLNSSLVLCVQRGKRDVPPETQGIKMAVPENTNSGFDPKAGGLPPEEIIFGRSVAMISIGKSAEGAGNRRPDPDSRRERNRKGLLAQYIHSRSALCSGAFVKVNCAAIPGALLESELFGYEKGSFTDAHTSKPGYVEMAHREHSFSMRSRIWI